MQKVKSGVGNLPASARAAAALTVIAAVWTVIAMTGLTGSRVSGVVIAVSADAIWAAVMYAEWRTGSKAMMTLGWLSAIGVAVLLGFHADEVWNEPTAFAAGALPPIAAKAMWTVAAHFNPPEPSDTFTREQREVLARKRNQKAYEAAVAELDTNIEITRYTTEVDVELAKDMAAMQAGHRREEWSRKLHRERMARGHQPMSLPAVPPGENGSGSAEPTEPEGSGQHPNTEPEPGLNRFGPNLNPGLEPGPNPLWFGPNPNHPNPLGPAGIGLEPNQNPGTESSARTLAPNPNPNRFDPNQNPSPNPNPNPETEGADPKVMPRPERVKDLARLITDRGGDKEAVKLEEVMGRYGIAKGTASTLRSDAWEQTRRSGPYL